MIVKYLNPRHFNSICNQLILPLHFMNGPSSTFYLVHRNPFGCDFLLRIGLQSGTMPASIF